VRQAGAAHAPPHIGADMCDRTTHVNSD
jgi:hypothetical protein